jgi:hypothetical protein
MSGLFLLLFNFALLPAFCQYNVLVAQLKYTKICIKTILYNIKNTIVSALNFNILKTNLSKIASKEVKILCF